MEEKKEGFEVAELDDDVLEAVAGGWSSDREDPETNGNCGGCNCPCADDEENV